MPPLRAPLVTIFYYVLHAEGKKEEHHIWWWLNVAIQSTRGHSLNITQKIRRREYLLFILGYPVAHRTPKFELQAQRVTWK